ncbi:MAG: DUF885 domain-containing protein [Hyphomonadaceae bacterium]|nr:DUF885 domain-containing protein [Hyphomonadaceae bacterium]MBX3510459.1 DUF885 domain-containing protein [Hyphomonadaceae bacterium]
MMLTTRRALLGAGAAGAALLATGCQSQSPEQLSAQLAALLDRTATEILRQSPEFATALAVSEERAGGRFVDRLSDNSHAGTQSYIALLDTTLRDLRRIDRDRLPAGDRISYDVVLASFTDQRANLSYDIGGSAITPYVNTQLTGVHNGYSGTASFLDAQHPLRTAEEAEAYLARLSAFARQLDVDTELMNADAAAGIIPPDFIVDATISQAAGFAAGGRSGTVLTQTLVRRLPQTEGLDEAQRAALVARAEGIVESEILPAYGRLIEALRAIRPRATPDAGIWHIPRGDEIYATALAYRTTTRMTPDEVHTMGAELVTEINSQMDAILREQGMTRGTVGERVQALSRRPDQLYPNTDAGRAQLLADLNQQVRDITALMPRAFGVLARAQMEIQRVPPYVEAGAPGGYYQSPALDGSRPGAYYINLRDTAEWPRFTLPTLSYHEGVPGHHWQGSIQQEAEGSIPFIRSALLSFTAFSEGWGLYAEQLADELGAYENNPLGRLGYLRYAAFRASRLVVDTGMHAKRWSREQAIRSMLDATGDRESSVTTEIERYCVWPGQACAYMVGRQAINRMRDAARTTLGDRFDLRAFHDTMLTSGETPLSVMEGIMSDWAARQRQA